MKNKNLKIYLIFAGIMLFSLVGGFYIGRFGKRIQKDIDAIVWSDVAEKIFIPSVLFFTCLIIIVYGACFIIYLIGRKKLSELEKLNDEEYEDKVPEIEQMLNFVSLLSAVLFIFSMLLFALVVLCGVTVPDNFGNDVDVYLVLNEVDFFVSMALFLTINALVVSLIKKINPEKRGNFFDLHFHKTWWASMDEAEVVRAGQACKKAYAAGMTTGFILWIVSFISMLTFHTGILPVLCVTVMLAVMLVTAEVYAGK